MPRDKNIFTLNPTSLDMRRSVFNRNSQHKTSFNLGQLVPLYLDEILPGDTVSMDLAQVIRMSTPIAPIMDNLYMDVYAFFVPNRLVWNHWQQFCGENDTGAWTQTTSYSIPKVDVGDNAGQSLPIGCIGDYFGLPIKDSQTRSGTGSLPDTGVLVSELPLRGLYKIANDWFYDENNIGPKVFTIGDNPNSSIKYSDPLIKVSRFHDLFSSCLPAPQKGASVALPLGTTAPVIVQGTTPHSMGGQLYFDDVDHQAGVDDMQPLVVGTGANTKGKVAADLTAAQSPTNLGAITKSNLFADLRNATAATINQIRYAFQVQKLLEKDARGGRYISLLFKKIAEKIWEVLVRIIRGEGICQPQRIDGEIIRPRGRDTFVKRYAVLCSNV